MSANASLLARSLAAVWHPCTQMKHHEQLPLIPIARGEGAWLIDMDGRRYLDGISSWWVNLFGHANPRINAALKDQLETLEHVMLAGFTHQPVAAVFATVSLTDPAGATPRTMSATREPRFTPATEVADATSWGATPAT